MRFPPILAIALLAAGARAREVNCWYVARNVRVELRAYPRGTEAPIELRLAKVSAIDSYPALRLPRTKPMRAEFPAAREWATATLAMYVPGDSSRLLTGARTTVLPGAAPGDSLVVVPLVGDDRRPDSARVRLVVAGVAAEVTRPAAMAWDLAWNVGELSLVLDPAGPQDDGGVRLPAQVDTPPGPSGRSCIPKYPWRQQVNPPAVAAVVQAQFVIDGSGRVEPASFRVLHLEGAPDFVESVREALPCFRYVPARLRERPVRSLVQQPFVFDMQQ